jgi:hypothetical protein
VRVNYSESVEHLIQSQFAVEIGAARRIAEAWKQAAIAKGFEETKTNAPVTQNRS